DRLGGRLQAVERGFRLVSVLGDDLGEDHCLGVEGLLAFQHLRDVTARAQFETMPEIPSNDPLQGNEHWRWAVYSAAARVAAWIAAQIFCGVAGMSMARMP